MRNISSRLNPMPHPAMNVVQLWCEMVPAINASRAVLPAVAHNAMLK